MRRDLWLLTSLAGLALAVPYDGPAPTVMVMADALNGFSPKPTDPPTWKAPLELFRRQSSAGSSSDSLPPNLCGYVSASSEREITCAEGLTCWFNSITHAVACAASSTSLTFWTSCVDSTALSACTGDCLTNTAIRRCSDTLSLCGTRIWPGSYTAYFCSLTSTSQNVDFTFVGQDVSPTTRTAQTSSSSSSSSSTSSSTTSSSTPTQSNDTVTSPTASAGSKTPVGAIVGGVIGGVAVLGLIGLGALFLIRRKKSKPANPPPPQPMNPHMSMPPPANPNPAAGAYYADLSKAGGHQPPMDPTKQPYVQPGGAYASHPASPGGMPMPMPMPGQSPVYSTGTHPSPYTPTAGNTSISPNQQFSPQHGQQQFVPQQAPPQQPVYEAP